MDVIFFVAVNDGNMLLSCKTTLMLGLIQPRTRLDYLPPRASLITSSSDHPKKTKAPSCVQKQEVATQMPRQKYAVPKLVTSNEQILHEYPDVFEGIGSFPGPPYHIQLDASVTPKQTPCHPIPIHL